MMRTRAQRRSLRGFTLPELLVVLAIIGLTLAIALPRLTGFEARGGLKSAARVLSSQLRSARNLAITNRSEYVVVIDSSRVITESGIPRPSTRVWIAKLDQVFDPATDPTDIAATVGVAPFDQKHTPFDLEGTIEEFPENIIVVASLIDGAQGNDFAGPRINVTHTEDADLDGTVVAAEDLGEDGVNAGGLCTPADTGNTACDRSAADNPVDIGEDSNLLDDDGDSIVESEIDPVVRYVRFGRQGNADRAIIYIWDVDDGRVDIPGGISTNFPQSLILVGLPPGMTLVAAGRTQQNYFQVNTPNSPNDISYYTVMVNPVTGSVEVYDYARGTGAAGLWNVAKDGA